MGMICYNRDACSEGNSFSGNESRIRHGLRSPHLSGFLLCKRIADLAMYPLTAARPWDDSAWAGTAHMRKTSCTQALTLHRFVVCSVCMKPYAGGAKLIGRKTEDRIT